MEGQPHCLPNTVDVPARQPRGRRSRPTPVLKPVYIQICEEQLASHSTVNDINIKSNDRFTRTPLCMGDFEKQYSHE